MTKKAQDISKDFCHVTEWKGKQVLLERGYDAEEDEHYFSATFHGKMAKVTSKLFYPKQPPQATWDKYKDPANIDAVMSSVRDLSVTP